MFKSLSLKISAMFVLLTISVIILIGTFMTDNTDRYYHNEFKNTNNKVFSDDYISSLCSNIGNENDAAKIIQSVSAYSGQLGIDSYRNYFLLDGKSGKTVGGLTTNSDMADSLEISSNIITAMSGKIGDEVSSEKSYMDYAVPLMDGNEVKYIVYIKDLKEDTNNIIRSIFTIILQALLLGIAISLVFAILLSITIISPIKSLTKKSQKMASGDFEYTIDVKSPDEIGQLTDTFNFMATELKTTMGAIQSEKEKVETIVQYMTDGVIAFNKAGDIIHVNPAAKSLLGQNDLETKKFDELFSQYEVKLGQILYFKHFDATERVINYDGKEISAYFAPFKTEDESGGVIVALRDITEREKLEKSRKEFVANVSHELRTPLTTVKSYTETLADSVADDSYDKNMFESFLRVINSETDRMTRLVKDLLLLSSLGHNSGEESFEEIDIAFLTENIVEKLQHYAKEKHQSLVYEPVNALPPFKGHRDRIEQVITNIITNAIKYTPRGGNILVTTMHVYDSISIKIKDTGIGIPKKDLDHIFERFYRVDKARSREMGGTGLGLAIAKEIVEAHKGSISIKSQPNVGTEVMIKLPAEKTTDK
ncbi:MAG: HAMP domain-containing protein [Clostridia bacterium]|nr:HAMP domain-containing protein [Clostridia bacterium]